MTHIPVNLDTDIDLYTMVAVHLERNVSVLASTLFKTDPAIAAIQFEPSMKQRYIINRYFYQLLLTFRANTDIPVFNEIAMLTPEVESKDWFKLFINFIVPFLNNNEVYAKLFSIQDEK